MREVIGEYDPSDGATVRLHDLAVLPGAQLGILGELEIQTVVPLHKYADGRDIVTIRSTGPLAAELSDYGLMASGHREWVPSAPVQDGLGQVQQATSSSCGSWPVNASSFAWFDPDPHAYSGGVRAEIQAMASSNVAVLTLGTSAEGRPILAARVGPTDPSFSNDVPTVYVLGTHHAREWIAEEVSLRLLRWAKAAVDTPNGDAGLAHALQATAVVFVPVVNPDGYQYSRAGHRDQRKNRRVVPGTSCTTDKVGVDVNRNYSFMWGSAASFPDADPCFDTYRGPSAASEAETIAVQALLGGSAFMSGRSYRQRPAAAVTYHSYGDLLIYPPGLKAASDAAGVACNANTNCLNPDLPVYRRLFGDTEYPLLKDTFSTPNLPFASDQQLNINYTTSGDMTSFANFGSPRVLAVTPELTGDSVNFYIECEPQAETIVSNIVEQHKALLKRLLGQAPALVSTSAASSYGPQQLGGFAFGSIGRETAVPSSIDTARPRLSIGIWRPGDSGAAPSAIVNGQTTFFQPSRPGVHYNGWYVNLSSLNPSNPFCVPCEINVRTTLGSGSISAACTGCVDLTDPNRLSASPGWGLRSGSRPTGGQTDYWWELVATPSIEQTLEIPAIAPAADATFCSLNFSVLWNLAGSPGMENPIILERWNGSSWVWVTQWPMYPPINDVRQGAYMRSYSFEANEMLGIGRTPKFRFRIAPGALPLSSLQIFDPLIACRRGSLP